MSCIVQFLLILSVALVQHIYCREVDSFNSVDSNENTVDDDDELTFAHIVSN